MLPLLLLWLLLLLLSVLTFPHNLQKTSHSSHGTEPHHDTCNGVAG
jgi:hypothetical protein